MDALPANSDLWGLAYPIPKPHTHTKQGVFYGVAMGSGNLGMVTVLYYGGQYVNQVRGSLLDASPHRHAFSSIIPSPPRPLRTQGLITVGDLSTMLLYSVYAGFSISALLSYYGDLMKARKGCHWSFF